MNIYVYVFFFYNNFKYNYWNEFKFCFVDLFRIMIWNIFMLDIIKIIFWIRYFEFYLNRYIDYK